MIREHPIRGEGHEQMKEKADAANKELSQSKEKPSKQKNAAAQGKSEKTEAEAKESDGGRR